MRYFVPQFFDRPALIFEFAIAHVLRQIHSDDRSLFAELLGSNHRRTPKANSYGHLKCLIADTFEMAPDRPIPPHCDLLSGQRRKPNPGGSMRKADGVALRQDQVRVVERSGYRGVGNRFRDQLV